MGFLATVLSFSRRVVSGAQAPEARVDRGGGNTMTAFHFSAPGDDSHPLPGDVAYLGDDAGRGATQVLGYQDAETAPVAGAGEKRIYARSGPGEVSAEVWLKADGSLLLKNEKGSIELQITGHVKVSTPLGAYDWATHTHQTPFGPSGPPIPLPPEEG